MKTIFALLMILLSAVLSAAAYGQLVKCVSKDGKVEYTRNCAPGSTEQPMGAKSPASGPGAGAPASQAPKSLAERDADFKKRMIEKQEGEQKDAKKLAETQQRRESCENAQAYLKGLDSGVRITRTDPKTGERIFLDDAERATETARARARVAENCK